MLLNGHGVISYVVVTDGRKILLLHRSIDLTCNIGEVFFEFDVLLVILLKLLLLLLIGGLLLRLLLGNLLYPDSIELMLAILSVCM